MSPLRTEPRITDPDGFYAALMEAHRELDAAASRQLDARLVLLLANHVGDMEVLMAAVAAARLGQKGPPAAGAEAPDPITSII